MNPVWRVAQRPFRNGESMVKVRPQANIPQSALCVRLSAFAADDIQSPNGRYGIVSCHRCGNHLEWELSCNDCVFFDPKPPVVEAMHFYSAITIHGVHRLELTALIKSNRVRQPFSSINSNFESLCGTIWLISVLPVLPALCHQSILFFCTIQNPE